MRTAQLTNDPRLCKRDLEKDDFLRASEILNDAPATEEQCTSHDPGSDGEQETEDSGYNPYFW